MEQSSNFAEFSNSQELLTSGLGEHCVYTIHVYPSNEMADLYITNEPIVYTLVVVAVFAFTTAVFLLYEFFVWKRQQQFELMEKEAARKNERLVSNLFPVQALRDQVLSRNFDRLFTAVEDSSDNCIQEEDNTTEVGVQMNIFGSRPIATLYNDCTVLFTDIAGYDVARAFRSHCTHNAVFFQIHCLEL